MNTPPKTPKTPESGPLTPGDGGYLPREERPPGYLWETDGETPENAKDTDNGDDDELFDDVPV